MFSAMMPKKNEFFVQFNNHADRCAAAGNAMMRMMTQLGRSPEEVARLIQEIDLAESSGDDIEHETIVMLHKSFITPIDRDQIHMITSGLDSILDRIQDVGESVSLYDIREATPEAREMAEIAADAVEKVRKAVALLDNLAETTTALEYCKAVDELESKADKVWRAGVSRLFREEKDPVQIIKLKSMYQILEDVLEAAEDVSHTLEEVFLANA
jgi:predicted phosphate transport protein (TIGR00153 family)